MSDVTITDITCRGSGLPIFGLELTNTGYLDACENSANNAALGDSDQDEGRNENDISETSSSVPQNAIAQHIKLGGSLLHDGSISTKKIVTDGDRDYLQQKYYFEGNRDPLLYQQKRALTASHLLMMHQKHLSSVRGDSRLRQQISALR
ncbi:hypothetical protein K1719_007360 [Acacia pycnantha]|nr:hypothetical protein K1719_007360 [Acacia pycnantha]